MHIPGRAKKIWSDWNSRAFVSLSLFLQIVLIFCGKLRKRNNSKLVSLIVWSAYLLADWVATFALGILSNKRNINGDLQAFWAPFLLLHLGGPDTITAFSIEDNELWLRHMLGLVFQVAVAIYVFVGSLDSTKLLAPALLMFLAGIIKYGEKSWALRCASMANLRKSTYAKIMVDNPSILDLEEIFMGVYQSQQQGPGNLIRPSMKNSNQYISHYFFPTLKHLIVDLILTIPERNESQFFFLEFEFDSMRPFKVIEIELSFLYEMLYTKSTAIHTTLGPFLRCISFSCILSSLLIFLITERHSHGETDVVITYLLLGGALFLEVYSVGLLVFSDWAVLRLKILSQLSNMIFSTMPCFGQQSRPRWSNSMVQYNLITFCLKDRPSKFRRFMNFLSVKEVWDKFWYTKNSPVTDELKKFIFKVLKSESSRAKDSKDYMHFSTCRGKHALKNIEGKHNIRELVKSVEVEFDQSILLWHIASDLCYYQIDNLEEIRTYCSIDTIEEIKTCRNNGKAVSDYMLYLLVDRPFMLPSRFGEIRYETICAEAKNIFHHQFGKLDEKEACKKLFNDQNPISLSQVEESKVRSVLLRAVTLATQLQELRIETRWKVIGDVWVEMLCYAAIHCRGIFHAKQLSAGGELLTMVWLLMAHLGIGQQYMTEENQATRTS